ncbi:MAG: type II toxin-antitoxin system VapC family toxin [Deltaproteobacteria bacterium]|nr:type II toxin-antitoxin system VapC family toxin [Deltaproteobacteria bacterium]
MICVDASLILKWITPEEDSDSALKLYKHWQRQKEILIAPTLLDYEVGSVLCKKVQRGLLAPHRMTPTLAFYRRIPIQLFFEPDLLEKAVALAQAFQESTIYDCAYLALAQMKETEYYTCDRRFFEKVTGPFPQVKYFKD